MDWKLFAELGVPGLLIGYLAFSKLIDAKRAREREKYIKERDEELNKTMQNHFHHSEMAYENTIAVVQKNTEMMTRVLENTRDCPYKNNN